MSGTDIQTNKNFKAPAKSSKLSAMIFAAGLGTRLKPWTDHHPKALAIVNGKSLLQRNIEYLQKHGIDNVIVNVHHFAGQVVNAIEKNKGWGSTVTISDESDMVLETGGGLKKAGWYFKNATAFVVMNADILTDMNLSAMIAVHESSKPLATLAVSDRESSRCFLFNAAHELKGWRNTKTGEEKPVPLPETNLVPKAFSGIHVLDTSIFSLMKQEGKFSMVDVYLDLAARNSIVFFDHSGSRFIDVGKPESVLAAEKLFI